MQIMIRDDIFKYEDGSLDTSDDELRVMNDKINKVLNPMPGKIYIIDGIRSLCLAINASYGGGMTNCWAVEGHSAQLTLSGSLHGYIKGKCLKIIDVPLGIIFQPSAANSWEGKRLGNNEKRFLKIDEVGRYDVNWF